MHRRDVIRAFATGLALPTLDAMRPATVQATQAIQARIRATPQDAPRLVLSEQQRALVSALAEAIIPETDTPGAAAARVDRFVDVMLADWFDEQERAAFLRGLEALDAQSVQAFDAPFLQLEESRKADVLHSLEAELDALRRAELPTDGHFFQWMKWLTLYGYYTSEVGATQELHAVIVPGRYDPCAPVARGASGR